MKALTTLILLLLLAVASPVFANNPDLPCQGLEQRVDFWKKVYTQYGADDVILHDRIYVNLIYGVVAKGNLSEKISEIRNTLREIQSNLETPNNLSPAALQLYQAVAAQGLPLSTGLFDNLIDRVHIQLGVKERFRDGIVRSGRYVEKFREIMKNHDVPTELALLPLVESSFQNARSKAGAVGVWQFTRGTGKLYMKVTGRVDERLDPVRSCEAAAHMLRDNYRTLDAWPLAITGYNHGRGGALQAKKLHGTDLPKIISEYRGPVFGYASMNFYSEFLAAIEVYENYPQYFGDLTLHTPDSATHGAPISEPSTQPADNSSRNNAAVAIAKYKVQHGDTLSEIAQRFGMPVRRLMSMNKLSKPAIFAGQILRVKRITS
jgi:membrane-bound lytic murein transglycosylase D